MRLTHVLLLSAAFLLGACQNSDKASSEAPPGTADISLRATSDIRTPAPIAKATFVPNSVASWLGHIILLDSRGSLHRATTDSAETEIAALGKYADVLGLSREKKAGVFLALTPQGQIKAFIESDDEGNFSPLAVSQPGTAYERFCAIDMNDGATIWTQSGDTSHKLTAEIFEESSLTLTPSDKTAEEINPCKAQSGFDLGNDYRISAADKTGLTLISGDKALSVDLTNGLSIGGMTEIGYVTGTQANMGSVFSEGLILAADKTDGRLVLISRSYILKELESR